MKEETKSEELRRRQTELEDARRRGDDEDIEYLEHQIGLLKGIPHKRLRGFLSA